MFTSIRSNRIWTQNDFVHRCLHNKQVNLMPGPRIYRPNVWSTFKSLISGQFFMKKTIDPNFTWVDFMKGAQHAVCVVSNHIADGNFYALNGLVTPEAIEEVKENISQLGMDEREKIRVRDHEVLFRWANSADYNGGNGLPWRVSIMTCLHALPGCPVNPQSPAEFTKFANTTTRISNYRFTAQYENGESDGWIIDFINSFDDDIKFPAPQK